MARQVRCPAELSRRWPDRGEVAYWLGNCKIAEGRNDEALEAWDSVADGARDLPLAAMSRARLAMELSRYGVAENSLKRAIRARGESSDEAWRLLSRVYWITGRRDEYRRLDAGCRANERSFPCPAYTVEP